MVALGVDGATANSDKKSGVRTIMKEEMLCTVFVCCMTYRLEKAIQDALKKMFFDEVDHMILRMFYLYQSDQKHSGK